MSVAFKIGLTDFDREGIKLRIKKGWSKFSPQWRRCDTMKFTRIPFLSPILFKHGTNKEPNFSVFFFLFLFSYQEEKIFRRVLEIFSKKIHKKKYSSLKKTYYE